MISAAGLTWGMGARFANTSGTFANNLTNMAILADRDGASGVLAGNLTNAASDWFIDASSGDLHLTANAAQVTNQTPDLASVRDDFDGQPRPYGTAANVGADEWYESFWVFASHTEIGVRHQGPANSEQRTANS